MFWQRVNYTQNDMQFTVYLTIYCVRMKEYFIHDPHCTRQKKKKKKKKIKPHFTGVLGIYIFWDDLLIY